MATWAGGNTQQTRVPTRWLAMLSVSGGYFLAATIGLFFSFQHPAASAVWPAAGVALGVILNLGYGVWPAIFIPAVVAYGMTLGVAPGVLPLAAANVAESLSAAYLINRFAGGRHALQNPRNSMRFAGIVLVTHGIVGPTLNSLSLIFSGLAPWGSFGSLWLVFGVGCVSGAFLLTPPVLLFPQSARRLKPAVALETCAVMVSVLIVSLLVFYDPPPLLRGFPTEFLCIPILMWPAVRLGRRGAAAALLLLSVIAIAGTLSGHGPFLRATSEQSLIIVQVVLSVAAVITISLSALASEYASADAQLRELVVTDALTGMPNYRRLVEVLSIEIARADRQRATFAVVFFDMDGLKRINDDLGHLTGSRAVCRFAETLRAVCRTTDTPARYGGDEFVAVLSDTDAEGASVLVRRVHERLAADRDDPPIAVSAGIATYPRDGSTPTTLLSAADRALYASKANKGHAQRRNVVAIREWPTAVGRS